MKVLSNLFAVEVWVDRLEGLMEVFFLMSHILRTPIRAVL